MIELRRAEAGDVDFLLELAAHPDVEPFLSPHRARTREDVAAEVERSQAEPQRFGRIVIRVDGNAAGAMAYEEASERNRIASLGALAIHPDFRGRKLADEAARLLQRYLIFELGFHRLQLEIYGFNERAQRHAERSGFVREGVKRKAYLRDGEWVDSVLYAIVREDLETADNRAVARTRPAVRAVPTIVRRAVGFLGKLVKRAGRVARSVVARSR